METTYTGFLAGITPNFLSVEDKKGISQMWLARTARLIFRDDQLIDVKLVWNG